MNEVSTQGVKILQGGFEANICALGEVSNLLKVNYIVNDKGVCCFLDSRMTNSFMILQMVEHLGVRTEVLNDSILVHMAQ